MPGYRLLARVGSGGAGEVWSAEAPGGLRVALKVVRLTGGLGRREVANVRILRAIRHPNLLAYFGAWRHRDRLIIGMELADGSLWDRLVAARREGLAGVPLGELLEVIGDAAKAVDFLNEPCHELDGRSGVAIHHRDIKPQNIMRIGRGVKVADLGLSCLDDPAGPSQSHCGLTFAYAAPETFRRQVSSHSDQYSLGVTYCHLRGGRLPFVGPPEAVMMGHLFGEPDLSMLPEPERPVVARAMAKDPAGRWPDCRSFARALTDCAEAGAPDTLPGSPGPADVSLGSSGCFEILPLPVDGDAPAPAAPDASIDPDDSADISAYCLDGRMWSEVDDRETASASPTVVLAELSTPGSRRPVPRFVLAAASILAAGLAVWSWSDRVATRAAMPAFERPRPMRAATNPVRASRVDPSDPGPAATGRDPLAPVDAGRQAPPPRPIGALAECAREGIAARLNEVAAWSGRIRAASATARARLASRSTAPRPVPPPRAPRLASEPTAPPRLDVGLPELVEIEAGRSVSIPIRVDGRGHAEALSAHFEGLPAGVTMPDVAIPAGQDRAAVVVRARLDAPPSTSTVVMAVRAGPVHADGRLRVRVRTDPARLSRARGHTLLACGRPAEAVAAFTESIRAGGADARVFHHRGLAYSSLDRDDLAIGDYTEAIRLGPGDAAILRDRGLAFARRGDDARALIDLDAALRLGPDDIASYRARAEIYRKHGDTARARADLGRAADLAHAARPEDRPPMPQPPRPHAAARGRHAGPGADPAALTH